MIINWERIVELAVKDLGVITSSELQINSVISKLNKMLSELKQTCIRLTYMKARRSYYLTHVKSQLCYAWEAPSHVYNVQLLLKRIEGVQRGARRWIMMS